MIPDVQAMWTLPSVHIPDKRIWQPNVGIIIEPLRNLLQADVTVLRTVYKKVSEDETHVALIYALDNQSEWNPPSGSRWVNRDELKLLALTWPEHRNPIESCLQEFESGNITDLRPPWAYPGWFKAAATWMMEQLSERGYKLSTPITQTKSWGISCLLRAGTDRGNVYFKVASALPLFGNEPALLKALAERYPEVVPAPIAIHAANRWMLMDDFGTELRSGTGNIHDWELVVERFAQLQHQTVNHIDDLLAVGCLDRRLDVLTSQIDPLMNDESTLATLTVEEIAEVRRLAPRLKAMCAELGRYRIPYTLNHGDLHSGNITEQTLWFFDWTDACIAHPFLDLVTLLIDAADLKTVPDGRERLLEIYLNNWTDYEPIERVREIWRLAEPLGALHQVVSYQHILAVLEPTSKDEMVWGVAEWLRRLLKAMSNQTT